jgi:hypothetical protein
VLDALKEHGLHATFCLVGRQAGRYSALPSLFAASLPTDTSVRPHADA